MSDFECRYCRAEIAAWPCPECGNVPTEEHVRVLEQRDLAWADLATQKRASHQYNMAECVAMLRRVAHALPDAIGHDSCDCPACEIDAWYPVRIGPWMPTIDGRHMLELLAEVERRGWIWVQRCIQRRHGRQYMTELDRIGSSTISEVADTPGRAVVLACLAAVRAR